MGIRSHWDVAIVGGGPAGTSLALHLAAFAPELAARTIVLERATYPREKYCAGAVGARALTKLARIGAVPEVPSVAVDVLSVGFENGETVAVREPGLGRVVRRLEFDHALAREVRRRGVELREGCAVAGVDVAADRATLRLESGERLTASVVVGADGVRSIVRRALGFARGSLRAQVIEVDTERLPGEPDDCLHFDFRYRELTGYAWDFPTVVDGRPMMCRGVYGILGRGAGIPVREHLARYLGERGLALGDYRLKQYAERGFNAREPLSAGRALLIGEAAGIDIATGEGIAQAIAYGELAAQYLMLAFRLGEFGFGDWRRVVQSAEVGRRLGWRRFAYEQFFGPGRSGAEALLRAAPALLQVGARDFARASWSPGLLARGVAQSAPTMLVRGPAHLWRRFAQRHTLSSQ